MQNSLSVQKVSVLPQWMQRSVLGKAEVAEGGDPERGNPCEKAKRQSNTTLARLCTPQSSGRTSPGRSDAFVPGGQPCQAEPSAVLTAGGITVSVCGALD